MTAPETRRFTKPLRLRRCGLSAAWTTQKANFQPFGVKKHLRRRIESTHCFSAILDRLALFYSASEKRRERPHQETQQLDVRPLIWLKNEPASSSLKRIFINPDEVFEDSIVGGDAQRVLSLGFCFPDVSMRTYGTASFFRFTPTGSSSPAGHAFSGFA